MVGGGEGQEIILMQFIIWFWNYGMGVYNNMVIQGLVSWDKEYIIFKGIWFSIIDVQVMMRMVVYQLEEVLYKDLFFCNDFFDQFLVEFGLFEILWGEFLDNVVDGMISYLFVDKLFQYDRGVSKGWVVWRILQDKVLSNMQIILVVQDSMELNVKVVY